MLGTICVNISFARFVVDKSNSLSPPPPCKKVIGTRTIQIQAGAKVRAHTRTIKVREPFKRCRCELPEFAVAAKSPDLNICENAFNLIQSELSRIGLSQGWPKNVDELEQRISEIIENIPKTWFKNSFASLPKRWRKCVKLGGKMTDFYIPKNTLVWETLGG